MNIAKTKVMPVDDTPNQRDQCDGSKCRRLRIPVLNSYCSICCNFCGVPVHKSMSSAKRRILKNQFRVSVRVNLGLVLWY